MQPHCSHSSHENVTPSWPVIVKNSPYPSGHEPTLKKTYSKFAPLRGRASDNKTQKSDMRFLIGHANFFVGLVLKVNEHHLTIICTVTWNNFVSASKTVCRQALCRSYMMMRCIGVFRLLIFMSLPQLNLMSFLPGNNMAWWLQQIPCWCKRFGSDGSEFDVLCIWNNNNCPRRCRNFGHIPTFVIKRGKIIISSFIALSIGDTNLLQIYLSCHKGSEKPPLKVCLFPRPLNEGGLFDPLILWVTHILFLPAMLPLSHTLRSQE